ncbi:dTDP-4-dehydrorhamnose reductase [Peristeroidobacter soli]|jgi:dTDP-4-dehydrorhamnose reductase|uniref:dTDP-4-dehydrorhamnose reductase n=1 Tax=Peristeroidobacter soli TaxID=2497877 RepID=UPI00101E0FAF|nr:dTDP-4-dehydrorhamnose reductase [Peristeroidobacter soli]
MKTLIVGAAGQLGRALLRNIPASVDAVTLDRTQLDITRRDAVEQAMRSHRPQVVINASAHTAVDLAESEPQRAYAINAEAVGGLAGLCTAQGIRFIHISTDFVFDGTSGRPYRPDDATHPLGVYGASKLAGEQKIAGHAGLDWTIVRTAWVYASSGRNFVLTMLRLFNERSVIRVVADQIGTPTSARSLSECVWRAATTGKLPGIAHFTDAGVASWYDFAVAIYEEATQLGLVTKPVDLQPIQTKDYPTPARRPSYSVLDVTATTAALGLTPVHWRTNLRQVLRELRA